MAKIKMMVVKKESQINGGMMGTIMPLPETVDSNSVLYSLAEEVGEKEKKKPQNTVAETVKIFM
jgi:hypothetical protein